MEERHNVLERSIGYLDMEQEALDIGVWIRNWSVVFILFGTVLEIGCFYVYNGVFHPFANILQDPSKDTCMYKYRSE